MNAIPYYKLSILIACPFAFCFLLGFFWILYKFYSKQRAFVIFESFLITVSITFFFCQSSIINGLTDLLNCTKIENNSYITNYLFEKCTDNIHYEKWRNLLVIPTFSIFCFVLPLVPFVYMFKNRKNLYNDRILSKVGFLLNGYSPQYYYWYFLKKTKLLNFHFKGIHLSGQKNSNNFYYFNCGSWKSTNFLPKQCVFYCDNKCTSFWRRTKIKAIWNPSIKFFEFHSQFSDDYYNIWRFVLINQPTNKSFFDYFDCYDMFEYIFHVAIFEIFHSDKIIIYRKTKFFDKSVEQDLHQILAFRFTFLDF